MLETVILAIAIMAAAIAWIIAILIATGAIALFIVRVPFAPTPKKNVAVVMKLFDLAPSQIFYDLGCGEGRFLMAAAKRGAKATGFEVSPWAYLRARLNIIWQRSPAQVRFKNFYNVDLSDADAVYCFLIDTVMAKVEAKLRRELKPGAKVISYGFKMPNWRPSQMIDLKPGNKRSSKIYLYIQN